VLRQVLAVLALVAAAGWAVEILLADGIATVVWGRITVAAGLAHQLLMLAERLVATVLLGRL
jgi:hypothetical protein